ncbi:YkgJ family cysteine cluster protein [Paenibacillus sp. EPM92]|uniref:YkgJ family cysteine cluster protein n=1 Tax=Paenibacillus sp. EPM92 TaxID=1561195 RepID=UPI001915F01F|nr:YkgJ family cysteine cluster protein [Paenibacillus sp. EPM92]
MAKKERCFCGSGKASKNCHRVTSDSRAEHLFKLFGEVDQAEKKYYENSDTKPQCYSGCNNCCSDFFTVSEVEFEIIMDEIHNTWTQEEIVSLYKRVMDNVRSFQSEHPELVEALNTQLDYERNINNLKSFKGKSRTSFPCPLLDSETGKCSVYEKRPFICRTHGTTHYIIEELRSLESTVCEYIPSRLKHNEVSPDLTDLHEKYEQIVNVITNKGSLQIRKLPIFYGIFVLASINSFDPSKPVLKDRHNLDMSMKDSNKMQLKKAASMG